MAQAELVVAAAKGPPDESAVSGRLQAADYAARVYVGARGVWWSGIRAVFLRPRPGRSWPTVLWPDGLPEFPQCVRLPSACRQ